MDKEEAIEIVKRNLDQVHIFRTKHDLGKVK